MIIQMLRPESRTTALALTGMPGIGKTACALEAVHNNASKFDSIIWHRVRARDSAAILAKPETDGGHLPRTRRKRAPSRDA